MNLAGLWPPAIRQDEATVSAAGMPIRPRAVSNRILAWHQRTGFAEAAWRHAAVDRLVLAGADAIRLVPDADIAARLAHPLVEIHPSRQMIAVRVARVGFERLERPPVLDDGEAGLLRAEKA